jgi:hypothetical protein
MTGMPRRVQGLLEPIGAEMEQRYLASVKRWS